MKEDWTTSGILNIYGNCSDQAKALPWTEGLLIKYFNDSDALNDYCTSDDYGKTWNVTCNTTDKRPVGIAIVFSDISDDGTQWTYEIRCNSSKVPGTLSQYNVDQFQHDMNQLWDDYAQEYYDAGFVELQVFVDTAITKYVSQYANVSSSEVFEYTKGLTKGYQIFPTASFKSDNYWDNIGFAFCWFIIFGFVYPFNQVASQLVDEKSFKTKEGMKMMGATVTTYWTGPFFWVVHGHIKKKKKGIQIFRSKCYFSMAVSIWAVSHDIWYNGIHNIR
ncbi:hypothetical protein RFI_11610 [Reticulomyxa filosa]|uniref:ABC-2 type transporter transmembrane domain-containing protein n=1 Tax=Reticulomyxa filosa TaxID=46433 RepID=X6NII4_RETFI|nr:hypothetical protein RFI_11610 [Reticulomyxa filosa]|eukprot:ETO25529.1 hypothetical protein RFI_11610 [Reticulomyxa filosa]